MDPSMASGAWWIFPVLGTVFVLSLCLIAVWLFAIVSRTRDSGDRAALGILRRRLAAGDITEEEYRQKRRLLAN